MEIDLTSDTVTRPTSGMLEAMMNAQVGDDVFKKDPTVNMLEARLAEMFNKEKALFFPTGTMANQTALKLHTNPGDQVICDQTAHIYNYEGGGASFNSGISCKLLDGERGMYSAKQVEVAINPPDFYHSPLTKLVSIENTSNRGGGSCWDFNEILQIREVCTQHNLGYHLDGARLFNALAAKGESTEQYGKVFDTISVCLSKGLGCPIGSVLIGDSQYMDSAIRIRKIFGGGMRQVGYLAAAGLYALDNHVTRLQEDHDKAKELEAVLQTIPFVSNILPVETNIVIFDIVDENLKAKLIQELEKANIFISTMGASLRIVTHLDYPNTSHKEFIRVLKEI
ncbi:MAG: PLP-dependent transferase [Flavobacteriaceae bacterium]|nr:PLP-dependent transferase [Flavobacteriaceae bacterium]